MNTVEGTIIIESLILIGFFAHDITMIQRITKIDDALKIANERIKSNNGQIMELQKLVWAKHYKEECQEKSTSR